MAIQSTQSTRVRAWLFTALLAASVGVNVLQAQRIRELVHRPDDARLVGARVEALEGTTPEGTHITVALGHGRPVLVYHFSTTCRWCEQNWANLAAVARHSAGRYRVLAITTETDVADWVAARTFPFEVLSGVSAETAKRLGLSGTPHTIMVGSDGLVTHEWYGAYVDRIGRQVSDLFDIRLPGLMVAADREPADTASQDGSVDQQ